MANYDFKQVEKKWQDYWLKHKSFDVTEDKTKPKYYALSEFPGPTAKGIHVGNARPYVSQDVNARFQRFVGFNVLQPIGWDAFGLPTENYALKMGIDPRVSTDNNIARFKGQLNQLGMSYDWSREVSTTDPEYYHWTQFIFLKLYENGLAYRSKATVNYCPKCQSTLSNEDSQGGVCDRCGSTVEQKQRDVWFLKITAYADKILDLLDEVDYPSSVKLAQRNWIGRSEGALVTFGIKGLPDTLQVFTTRIDTIAGVAYMSIAPEHNLIDKYAKDIKNIDEILKYREEVKNKTSFERTQVNKDKTGLKIDGLSAINPLTGKEIPIYVADYVVISYGTGAVMAVPAHDDRDYEFAKAHKIDFIPVLQGGDISAQAFTEDGPHINSGEFDGLNIADAKEQILKKLNSLGKAEKKVNYKMQDWAFNRQRYWGEPFPIIHCPHCGIVPLKESDLPLELPVIDDYRPNANGDSPLSRATDWVNVKCPKCGKAAKREVDIMPNWAGSSWYWLRFMDAHNKKELASKEKMEYWGSVDLYTGGFEHVTRHMIYAQFWHLFLYDLGIVPNKIPFAKRVCCGLVLAPDGSKMSKSKGTSVDPVEMMDKYGTDAFRMYMIFVSDYTKAFPWSESNISGCVRFLDRVWGLKDILSDEVGYSKKNETILNQTIKKVSFDYKNFTFNTIVSTLMEFVNKIYDNGSLTKQELNDLLIMLNPIAPHITSEMFETVLGKQILGESFPTYDEKKCIESTVELPVQINGKVRGTITVERDCDEDAAVEKAKQEIRQLENAQIRKVIFVKNKILNIIV